MIQLIKNIYFKLFKKKESYKHDNNIDNINDKNDKNNHNIDIISCKIRYIKNI